MRQLRRVLLQHVLGEEVVQGLGQVAHLPHIILITWSGDHNAIVTLVGFDLTSRDTSAASAGEKCIQAGRKTARVGEMSHASRAYSRHCFSWVFRRT